MTRIQAAKLGLTTYQYKPCQKCGHEERYVKYGSCPICSANRVKKHREKYNQIVKEAQLKNQAGDQNG